VAARHPLYRLRAAGPTDHRGRHGDGQNTISPLRPRRIRCQQCGRGTRPACAQAYDKIRIRRSIEYPVTGVRPVALKRRGATFSPNLRVAFTGTNPRPVLLERHVLSFAAAALDEARCFKGPSRGSCANQIHVDEDDVHARATTARRVAGVLARRLVERPVRGLDPRAIETSVDILARAFRTAC